MPYFKDINGKTILLVHIPKTGGSSLEEYFASKISLKRETLIEEDHLFSDSIKESNLKKEFGKTPQHFELKLLIQNKDRFNINIDIAEKITVVRNPYTRLISELLWLKKINNDSSKEDVYNCTKKAINDYHKNNNVHDNHIRPQYQFLIDENNKFYKDLIILRQEKLTEMMKDIGYNDFNENVFSKKNKPDYNKFLSVPTIRLINKFYKNDFLCFGYKMKVV